MELAKNLKRYREKCGFSQQEVAKRLNLTRQSISKWENGKGYPDLVNLVSLAKLYQVFIDCLVED